MAALSEDGRYGLNCGRQSADRVTVLHVKLTETALKAIECHQKSTVSWTWRNVHLWVFSPLFGYKTFPPKKMTTRKSRRGRLTQLPSAGGSLTATHR